MLRNTCWVVSPRNGTASGLARIRGIGHRRAAQIRTELSRVDVDAELRRAAHHDLRVLCPADEAFPPGLRTIPDPPIPMTSLS